MDKQERIAFFHEDDYCQREILPLAAKSFCLRQIKEINDFSQMHRAANGLYTDIYIREKPTHVIEELVCVLSDYRRLCDFCLLTI